ncbi:MAG: translocation/assembly module TamB domain-containing protein, partial [Chroococcidiopsidaceae cyanobacterium CP_BM_RX_35]|nr:translocation/assembly module TamB domain-containing protein [Chroococcidiopsidaceae cyanobacterium CP_BM_RX_35]
MTNPPNPEDHQSRPRPRLVLLLLSRTHLTVVVILLIGLAGGVFWLWSFIQKNLGPLVQKNLVQIAQRPVKLGRVEGFSPFSLRFGPTSIPATASDPDHVSLKAIDVTFNPLQVLFTRTLHLNVTLEQPDAYIQQDKEGRWVRLAPSTEQKPGPVKIQLDKVQLHNAHAVLVAYPKPGQQRVPFAVAQINGSAQLPAQQQQPVNFELGGQPLTGGSFKIQGQTTLTANKANIQLQGQNLLGADLTRLVKLPLEIRSGRVDGNLTAQIDSKLTQPLLSGTANLKSVTAKFDRIPEPFNNTKGGLSFNGTQVGLDNVTTSFGKVPLLASGSLDTLGDFNLFARVPTVSLVNVEDTFNLKLPVATKGSFGANLRVTGPIAAPVLSGSFANLTPVRVDRVGFKTISSQLSFAAAVATLDLKNLQVIPTAGGKITGAGSIGLGPKPGTGFNVQATNIPGDALARLYGVPAQVHLGPIAAKAKVTGTVTNLQTVASWQLPQATYPTTGQATIITGKNSLLVRNALLSLAGGTIKAAGQLANGRFQAAATVDHLYPGKLNSNIAFKTPLSGALNISGRTTSFKPEAIALQGSGHLNIAGGTVTASNIHAAGGRFQVSGNLAGIKPENIAQVPPALRAPISGTFNLSGSTASFQPQNLALQGDASVNVAGGTVTASNIQTAGGQWRASGTVSQLPIGSALPQLPSQVRGTIGPLNAKYNLFGSLTALNLNNIQGNATGGLSVAGGTVRATNVQLASGQVQVAGTASGIQLQRLLPQAPPQFQGTLQDGRFNLSGNLAALSLPSVRGNASGSLGVAGGTVTANNIQFGNGRVSGSVTANQVNLEPLAAVALTSRFGKNGSLPDIRGRLNANVNFSSSLSTLNLSGVSASGQLRLQDLAAGGLAFDPVLSGNVNLSPGQGANLQLAGAKDQISLVLSPNYKPVSFLFQLGSAIATGKTSGEILQVTASNFPLSIFKAVAPLPPILAAQPVSGILDANVGLNLNTYAADGNLAIARPGIGTFIGDQFTAQFRYANGGETLANGVLTQGPVTRYTLAGSLNQTSNGPQFQVALKIAQAQVQTLLTSLQLYKIQDFKRGLAVPTYAKADAVTTTAVGSSQASLLTQLNRYSEIKILQQQLLAQQQASPLPPLSDFRGTIDGELSANGSLKTGVAAKFNLLGSNWQWGTYVFNPVIARGSFNNGVLTILPFRINSNLGQVAFVGQVGGPDQSGQLRVRNFPIGILNQFVKSLPISVAGLLNATATVAGSQKNPQAIGEIDLTGATLNQQPINSATTSFSYNNARLNFDSSVVVANSHSPIQINGSIPYALPSGVKPNNDQISLNVNVQNQGLGLLNVLTNQVAWEGGQGRLQVQGSGTLRRPLVTGTATISNATISAAMLPKQPLTNVNGTARFNGDRIQVDGIQGQFKQGTVAAQGAIPIFAQASTNAPVANPLTVALNQLKVNLPDYYQGGVDGNVVITGSALQPVLGGNVMLSKGQV